MTTNTVERRVAHLSIVGESALSPDVLRKATLVAATEATVLLRGESRTGKESSRGSYIAHLFEAEDRSWH